jgi:RimJ/RimL family protein N-acetyltransferase
VEIHPVTLSGKYVQLEPLTLAYVPDLTRIGLDPEIWQFMLYGEIHSETDMKLWVVDMLQRQAAGGDLPFVVIHLGSNRVAGATRYLNIETGHRNLEIGGTWYGREFRGTKVNLECKYLLLRHAFEELGCVRVQLKTDARNMRSQRAIERIGAVKEGILRSHMITPGGYVRDSVYYSIIDNEWAGVKSRLEQLLGYSVRKQ